MDPGALLLDLRDLIGVPMDVVTVAGMHERMRGRALKRAVLPEDVAAGWPGLTPLPG